MHDQPTKKAPRGAKKEPGLRIQGKLTLEQMDEQPEDLALRAYAFNAHGQPLGSGEVDAKGGFSFDVSLKSPAPVELVVGPQGDPHMVRRSSAAYTRSFLVEDWRQDAGRYVLRPELEIARLIWWPWRPVRICVSGHVRKVHVDDGLLRICPVPFVKVEVFDVDREGCLWPPLRLHWEDLLDRYVVRIPDLIGPRPLPDPPDPGPFRERLPVPGPIPGPIPGPDPMRAAMLDEAAMNIAGRVAASLQEISAAELAERRAESRALQPASLMRVGEVKMLSEAAAARLEKLTFTDRIAPWLRFPFCFYSVEELCETYTDCDGYFRCCFRWWPFHFRNGRLRYDSRPDIILKVTQIIDGVETVVYLDPYTSTRWNSGSTHIDLYLDNEEVRCGHPACDPRPPGSVVYFTRIGDEEVYDINQGSGLYSDGTISNLAYGGGLRLHAHFGQDLSDGTPPRYYRLSYAEKTGPMTPPDAAFQPIAQSLPGGKLTDTRVNSITLVSEDYDLGPKTVGAQVGLFEVRDMEHFGWYNPDHIGTWLSAAVGKSNGLYVLRLEVFDENGNKLNTPAVDYRDGTDPPPGPLPPMTDACDLVIYLDNNPVSVGIVPPATTDPCGLLNVGPADSITFRVNVQQGQGRINRWNLRYKKGITPGWTNLDADASNSGLPDVNNHPVTVLATDPMLADISAGGTCAFTVHLGSYAHITDGRRHPITEAHNLIYWDGDDIALAIHKTP
jgi:hypothetical protein